MLTKLYSNAMLLILVQGKCTDDPEVVLSVYVEVQYWIGPSAGSR